LTETKSKISWDFRRTMEVISTVVGIAGFILGIYFYYEGKKSPELTFSVNPVKLEIVSAGQATKLVVSFIGKAVESDITSTQVALWNQGKAPIRRADLLTKSVVIYTDPKTPILEATIIKTSRDIIQLSLSQDELQEGRIPLTWEILEQGDGGVIEIIYAGKPDITFKVDGIIVGQKEISRYGNKIGFQSPNEEYEALRRSHKFARLISLPFALMAAIGLIYFGREIIHPRPHTRPYQRKASYILVVLLLLMIGLLIALFKVSWYPQPPYGL
jgi:hypothetical protein